MKVLIYGLGGFTKRYISVTEEFLCDTDIVIVGFVDKRAEQFPNGYRGNRVFRPQNIEDLEFDVIVVFAFKDRGVFCSIQQELIYLYNIETHRIWTISDLLIMAQSFHRESIDVIQSRKPRVYDCFQFYNELEILQIRMELLDPFVDCFVIVELEVDHHGMEKPKYFDENRHLFEKYENKIIYVCPTKEEIPQNKREDSDQYGFVWTIEQYQRRCITKGLVDAQPEDLIIISDCDEIPDPRIIKEIRDGLNEPYPSVLGKVLEKTAVALRQEYYYFYFNCRNKIRKNTTTIVKYKNLINPQVIRDVMNCLPYIDFGGWHLTYFGGVERIQKKIKAIVEGEYVDEEVIRDRITHAQDIYGREGKEFELEYIDVEEITIPQVDKWIEIYPNFFLSRK